MFRAALLLFALTAATAQDLPPRVLLLRRIKDHMRQNLERLPDYTCLETAQRFYNMEGTRPATKPVDTLRLEVLLTGKHELYAAPGDFDFREEHPGAFAMYGLTGSGLFASFLRTLFVNDNGIFTWRGEESLAGRRAIRYDFRVPLVMSGWTIVVETGSGSVSMRGTIWADPESLDLLRLKVEAGDIPSWLGVSSATVILDYGRTRIGNADVLLPQTGALSMVRASGRESRNVMEFTHCRAFRTQSTLSFDAPAALPPSGMLPERVGALPQGLPVTIRLAVPVAESHGVRSAVDGIVAGNVVDKGKVVVPDGARVIGRIRRLERYEDNGGFFMVGIEFTEIRFDGAAVRFYADLIEVESRDAVEMLNESRMAPPDLPGVGVFFVRKARFAIPEGLRMSWRTRSLSR